MPRAHVGEEGGQPAQCVQRPLGQRATEGDPVMITIRPSFEGGGGQQGQMILVGQGPRVAGENVLIDFPHPLRDRRRGRPDRGVRQAVQRDPGSHSANQLRVSSKVRDVRMLEDEANRASASASCSGSSTFTASRRSAPRRASTSPAQARKGWTGSSRRWAGSVSTTWKKATRDGSGPEPGRASASFIPHNPPRASCVAGVSHPIAADLA